MDAIHIIMATSTSANPHNAPNARIESLARKRKISAVIFFLFGIILLVAGCLLAVFEKQRFSVSFIIFGGSSILFAFMYWISAEKITMALRKFHGEQIRQARYHSQDCDRINFANMNSNGFNQYLGSFHISLPNYEQSLLHPTDVPPPYEEAIKTKSTNNSSLHSPSLPIRSISFGVNQADVANTTTLTSETIRN